MRTWIRMTAQRAGILLVLGWMSGAGAQVAPIGPDLAAELAVSGPQDEIAVIVSLADRVDPRLYEVADRSRRDTRLVGALMEKAAATQATYRVFLQNNGARQFRELWVINGFAVTARASVIRQLASRPGIELIRLDSTLEAPVTTSGTAAPPEWNLNAVRAPELWSLGFTGSGVVVANMDTGVDPNHPDLSAKWRGGDNSWYDPHGEHATPYDPAGHGTQTMGIMVGGAAGGTAIGMAPDARWIAAKLYNDAGYANYSDIHLAFQWLLDPDGDLGTVDAPDVVNASWGLTGTTGQCITEFATDIDVLKAAGTAIAFAAGNDGPSPLTSLSPANNPPGFAAGAVDADLAIASFSSRGPSACDGTVYPELVAPGVNVNTADLSFGGLALYAVVSGTSYAAPHAAGAMALLAEAFPSASIGQIEAALTASAQDLGVAGEDNSYGYGLADVEAAYRQLSAAPSNQAPFASGDAWSMEAGTTLDVAAPGVLGNDGDADGDQLTAVLDAGPASGSLALNGDGSFSYTPDAGFAGTDSFAYRAFDGALHSDPATVSITVNASVNTPPLAKDDSAAAPVRKTASYTPKLIAVLANDTDPDGNLDPASVAIAAAPNKGGTVTVNADGTVSYTPKLKFRGKETFKYTVRDQAGALSNAATVTVNVK
ncbi:MAG: S8 family serine peptidase [Thiobacillus sp.]|nr:S8 family serine peptidase [Thiobacillus sp.]